MGAGPNPRGEEELTLRRFLLPGLFVLTLFVTLWVRRPEAPPAPAHQPPSHWTLGGDIFGTTWSAQIVPKDAAGSREALREAIAGVLSEVDSRMSTYKPDSELSKLNADSSEGNVAVSHQLGEMVAQAKQVYELSGGAFDVTVGPLVNAWGFGPAVAAPPSEQARNEALARIGSGHLTYSPETGLLTRAVPGIEIDLSAIAKGYAVDQVAREIAKAGHTRYLVEIGGEVHVQGLNSQDRPWGVGIETPDGGEADVAVVLRLQSGSLATSGNYRNLRTVDGRLVTHIIDPRSGEPVSHGLGSVSVLHQDCAEADALATALYVLGWDEGFELAERKNIAALFLNQPQGSSSAGERITSEFQRITGISRVRDGQTGSH